MDRVKVTRAFSTGLGTDKVMTLADEAGVSVTHVETRLAGRGKWLNDYEVTGAPGKVDKFFERVDDIRVD